MKCHHNRISVECPECEQRAMEISNAILDRQLRWRLALDASKSSDPDTTLLTPIEADARFGELINETRTVVKVWPDIEEGNGTWKPIFDNWFNFAGYAWELNDEN